jgi:hypothetical protein
VTVPTTVTWRDLTLTTGAEQPYRITALDGWESRPAPRYEKTARARAHGAHPSPIWSDERLVTVEGFTHDEAARDALLHALQAAARYSADPDDAHPLTVALAGRTLTAAAQVLRFDPVLTRGEWGIGRFGWVIQWRCPDPLRYGPARVATTGLPTSGGGLTYPLTYPLGYGELGDPGQVALTNEGTADAPIVFDVTGPLEHGFDLSAGGQRITYPLPVPAGQTVTVDTGAGTALVEGTSSRRAALTAADWLHVPAGTALTVQFTSLGGAYDPAASLTARWSAAYW